MRANGLVLEECLLGAVLGQLFFVRDEIVNARMALLTQHEAALAHLFFAEPIHKPLFAMNASGDEVMLGQTLGATAQLAALFSRIA